MIKTLYILLALTTDGQELVIDSQLTESDCIAAMAANYAPEMQIGTMSFDIELVECQLQD